MTRRLHACLRCGGCTRHADQRCSRCRRGLPVVSVLREVADVGAPTVAELRAARPIGHLLEVTSADPVVYVDFRGRGA